MKKNFMTEAMPVASGVHEFNDMADTQYYMNLYNEYKYLEDDVLYDNSTFTAEPADYPKVDLGDDGEVNLDKIAKVESNGDYLAQNPTSSAKGKYQFIDSTRAAVAKQYAIEDTISPTGQETVMRYHTRDNVARLKKQSLPVNTLTAYALHQQGASGGVALLHDIRGGKAISGTLRTNVVNNTPEKYRTGNPSADWVKAYGRRLY